jgi:hypothetical protein
VNNCAGLIFDVDHHRNVRHVPQDRRCVVRLRLHRLFLAQLWLLEYVTTIPDWRLVCAELISLDTCMNPIVYSYNAEIHSYSTRAKGVSVYWGGIELQAIINRYINPVGIANLGWKFYFVYLAFYFVELAFMYYFLPETKGRSLVSHCRVLRGLILAERLNRRRSQRFSMGSRSTLKLSRNWRRLHRKKRRTRPMSPPVGPT